MHTIVKTIKLFGCAMLLAVTFPMSVYAGSDEGAVEVTGSEPLTLEEVVKEEPDVLKYVQATAAEAEDEYMAMAVEIKGNRVLYVTTFKDAFSPMLTELVVQGLKEGMDGAAEEISALAGTVDDAMNVPRGTVSMVIRFCDSDGRILAETECRAE